MLPVKTLYMCVDRVSYYSVRGGNKIPVNSYSTPPLNGKNSMIDKVKGFNAKEKNKSSKKLNLIIIETADNLVIFVDAYDSTICINIFTSFSIALVLTCSIFSQLLV